MNRHELKTLLFSSGISAAATSSVLFFAPKLVDAQAAQFAGYYGMVGAASTLTVWAVLELWPEQQRQAATEPKERQASTTKPDARPKPVTPQATTAVAKPATPKARPEPAEDPDEFGPEHGYKPQRYMLTYCNRIEKFIARKLAQIDGAKPWTVAPPFASLNSIVIDIDPRDRQSLLYSTDFSGELFTKLPEGSELRRAARGRKFPSVIIPRRQREFIRTADALPIFLNANKSQTAALLGFNDDMETIAADFKVSPHLFVFGETGGGKGVCIHNMLMSLMMKNSPAELQVIRCDPKGTELRLYDELPHVLGPSVKSPLEICDRVAWCIDEMDRRNDLFGDHKIVNITEWNQTRKTEKLPVIILAFDEMLDFYKALDREDDAKSHSDLVTGRMESLVNKARSAGIHVIAVTQVGNDRRIKDIARGIKTNIAFACKKNAALQLVSDDGDLYRVEELTGSGHGLVLQSGATEFQSSSTVIEENGKIIMDCRREIVAEIKQKYADYAPAEFIRTDPEPDHNPLASTDELYLSVVEFVAEQKKLVQRDIEKQFNIGGTRCKKLIAAMETDKFIGAKVGRGQRRNVLITPAKLRRTIGEASAKLPGNVIEFSR